MKSRWASRFSSLVAILLSNTCPAVTKAGESANVAEGSQIILAGAETAVGELTVGLRKTPQNASLWHERGQARLKLSDQIGALADFSEAIRLAPFVAEYRSSRAQLLGLQGRWPEVIADTTDGIAADPKRVDLALLRSRARRSLGLLDLALSDCNRVLGLSATNVEALLERAWVYSFQTNWTKALGDTTTAVSLAPGRVDVVLLQGIAHRERREWPEAIDCFGKVIQLAPTNALAYLNRGRAQMEQTSLDDAMTDLNKAISLDSRFAEAYLERGRLRTARGDFARAVEDLSTGIRLRPDAARGYFLRAVAYEKSGKFDAAGADVNIAASLGTVDEQILGLLTRADERQGDWELLQQHSLKLIDLRPSDSEGYRLLGRSKRMLGDTLGASAAYEKAIQTDAKDWRAYVERATLYSSQKDYAPAIRDCSAAVTISSNAVQAYALRAYALYSEGRFSEALADCDKALAIDTQQATSLLVRARILIRKGDAERALLDCREALKLSPQLAWGYSTLGMTLSKAGDYDEAIKALSRAIQLAPRDAEALATRGRTYLAMHRYRSAIEDLDGAVSLDPGMKIELAKELEEVRNKR